jgi:putative addiction module killer protein
MNVVYGPGYRVYLGRDGMEIVILLIGGDKSTQDRDIRTAKKYGSARPGRKFRLKR